MRVLIIDCTMDLDSWGGEDFRRILSNIPGLEIVVRRAPHEDLPQLNEPFDRILVSGSRTSCFDDSVWVNQLLRYLKEKIKAGIPVLGVCFGLQMIARLFAGKESLVESKSPEYGWIELSLRLPHPLLKGLPKSFYTLGSHREELAVTPTEFVNLASSRSCNIQAIAHQSDPVFGIQFHPEKKPSLKKDLKSSKKLYNPKIGEIILTNFINYEPS